MHWLSTRIQARIQTAAALDLGIEEARQTLARLEATTWGITLQEIEGSGSWCCRPARWPIRPGPWGHSAGREAVERVKELYDRVRTAVDEGLAGMRWQMCILLLALNLRA